MNPVKNCSSALNYRGLGESTSVEMKNTENGFTLIDTPILTGSDCEGAGELFRVTTLDLEDVPTVGGKADYSADFFGKNR